jgi:DNA polymerase-4
VRLCPQAVVVPVRMSRYREVSDQVFEIFHRFTPLVEGLSLDEAFLDVTASRALFGDGVAIARSIKEAIRGELDLVASAGVASCKFVAKIASDLEKPDGLTVVDEPNVGGRAQGRFQAQGSRHRDAR